MLTATLGPKDVLAAAERISGRIRRTPALELGEIGGASVVAKLEFLQHTGSFKPRGAFNKLLSSEIPPVGVIAASGGNFGSAVAYAAREVGVPAEVFIPSGGLIGILAAFLLLTSIGLAFSQSVAMGLNFLLAVGLLMPLALALAIHLWPRTPVAKRIFLKPPDPDDTTPEPHGAQRVIQCPGSIGTVVRMASCGRVATKSVSRPVVASAAGSTVSTSSYRNWSRTSGIGRLESPLSSPKRMAISLEMPPTAGFMGAV